MGHKSLKISNMHFYLIKRGSQYCESIVIVHKINIFNLYKY